MSFNQFCMPDEIMNEAPQTIEDAENLAEAVIVVAYEHWGNLCAGLNAAFPAFIWTVKREGNFASVEVASQ